MPKKLTHEEFLEKLREKNYFYKNGEFQIISEYMGVDNIIEISSKFGKCRCFARDLLSRNYRPSISSAIDKTAYFKNEVLFHNVNFREGLFDIVGEYTSRKSKILVTDEFGDYNVITLDLLCNYRPNILSASNKSINCTKRFEKFRKDYKNIDYSQVKYLDNRSNLELRCKIHDYKYAQRVDHHNSGVQGCSFCMSYPIMYSEDTILKHKVFLQDVFGVLYILKLTGNDESFYKVGITSMDRFQSRMKTLKINYDVEILYTENADMISNFRLEQKFISEFKEYRYIPKIKFSGYTECFKVNPLEYYYHHKTNNNESNN